jgi:hypothetical protein
MSFNGNEGEFVTLSDASRWTANYRNTIQPGDTIAFAAGKEKLIELLNQDECLGARIVGVDENGNDLEDGLILERISACPPFCSKRNKLNS